MRNIYFILFFISIALTSKSQIGFQQQFTSADQNFGNYVNSIMQNADSGFTTVGMYQYYQQYDTSGILMIRTDKYGNEIWNRVFSGWGLLGNRIVKRSSGGFYLLTVIPGYNSPGINNNASLIAFDDSLNILWSSTFALADNNYQRTTLSEGPDETVIASVKGQVARYDKNGTLFWCKVFQNDSLNSIDIQAHSQGLDSTLILVGNTNVYNSFNDMTTVIKTDYYGNVLWSKEYDDSANFATPGPSIIGLHLNTDGTILTGGTWGRYFTTSPFLMKLDVNGDILWTKYYEPNWNYYGAIFNIIPKANGNLVLFATTSNINGQVSNKPTFVEVDSFGNVLNIKAFGKPDGANYWPGDFIATSDNGYASVTSKGNSPYLIKTDSVFNSNCFELNLTYTPFSLQYFEMAAGYYSTPAFTTATLPALFLDSTTLFYGPCLTLNEAEITDNSVLVFPNPFKKELNFTFYKNKHSNLILKIYDASGRMVLVREGLSIQNTNSLQLQNISLQSGFYFFTISDEAGLIEKGKLIAE